MNKYQFSFRNDYSQVAHPDILDALSKLGNQANTGYGLDYYSKAASTFLQNNIGFDVDIHFLIGGTSANKIAIAQILKPYQAVISATSGHINVHETGAIEATGHKVISVPAVEGKILPSSIEKVVASHTDEHMVMPKLVYISQATELGTVYTKAELSEIYATCKRLGLYLYIDGARLGVALTSDGNDLTLTDIAKLSDAFTIGGTKNGMMIGEALIIVNQELRENLRFTIKREAGMLAKGFIIGLQFLTAFQHNLFWNLARHANQMAQKLKAGLERLNIPLYIFSPTNQQFLILSNEITDKLKTVCDFEEWGPFDENNKIIRLVTSWATLDQEVEGLLNWFQNIQNES